jgi:altronate hydrolase
MTEHQTLTVRLHPNDNVVTARIDLLPKTAVGSEQVSCETRIPAGHKVATRRVEPGEPIKKYNQIIGFATEVIEPGQHVHTHNVEMRDFARDYAFGADVRPTAHVPADQRASFQGFLRDSGRAGTRNFIGVLSTVNCSATVCHLIAETFPKDELAAFGNVDGIVALTHGTGCGMADRGEGFATLQRTLWGYARHPNFAGVLLVGLGCEVNQIDFLLEAYQIKRGPHFRTMTMQGSGGTRKTVERAQAMIREMLPHANAARRQRISASELSLALQCGGCGTADARAGGGQGMGGRSRALPRPEPRGGPGRGGGGTGRDRGADGQAAGLRRARRSCHGPAGPSL